MSGDGSDETSAAWERVNGDMSPGSSQLVQDAVSEPLRAATSGEGHAADLLAVCRA